MRVVLRKRQGLRGHRDGEQNAGEPCSEPKQPSTSREGDARGALLSILGRQPSGWGRGRATPPLRRRHRQAGRGRSPRRQEAISP
jgi:hypothetical protein